MISTLLTQAKINQDIQRRKDAAKAIDFYNYQQKVYMEDEIARIYPATYTDVKEYIRCNNLTQSIIDDIAILFQNPIKVDIDGTDQQKKLLSAILLKSEFWTKMLASDKYADLTNKVGIAVHWHPIDKRVVLDIITPDKCFVIQDKHDPTKASKVYYQINELSNTPTATPVIIHACWTAEEYYEVEVYANYTEGKVTEGSRIPNPYNRIPIVWLSKFPEANDFWPGSGYPLIDTNINVNLRETNLDLALDFQTFSTLVTSGLNSSEPLTVGLQRRIDLPVNAQDGNAQGSAEYITPNPKLTEVAQIIESRKIEIARQNGLSAEAYNRDTSNYTSGYQLRLSKQDVLNDNELKKEIYKPSVIQLVHNMLDCYSFNSTGTIFAPDIEITVEFPPVKFETSQTEQRQLDIIDLSNGLRSRTEIIMRDRNCTLEQATAIIKEIDAEKALNISATAIPEIPE